MRKPYQQLNNSQKGQQNAFIYPNKPLQDSLISLDSTICLTNTSLYSKTSKVKFNTIIRFTLFEQHLSNQWNDNWIWRFWFQSRSSNIKLIDTQVYQKVVLCHNEYRHVPPEKGRLMRQVSWYGCTMFLCDKSNQSKLTYIFASGWIIFDLAKKSLWNHEAWPSYPQQMSKKRVIPDLIYTK